MPNYDINKRKTKPSEPLTKTTGNLSPIFPPADLPERCPEAHQLFSDGLAAFTVRDFDTSLEKFTAALERVQQAEHQLAQLRFLYDIGIVQLAHSEPKAAFEAFQEGLSLARKIPDKLADEYRQLVKQAERLSLATDGMKVIGTPQSENQMEIMFLRALSVASADAGLTREAKAYAEEALQLAHRSAGQR